MARVLIVVFCCLLKAAHSEDISRSGKLDFEGSLRASSRSILEFDLEFEKTLGEAMQSYDPAEQALVNLGLRGESMAKFLEKYDIPVYEEEVPTEDGYQLGIFRLENQGRPVIMFQHGIASSSWCWVQEPHLSSAIVAWKMGYDVWLTNSRGNTFSAKHKSFESKASRAFWDFSFADMGREDIPANVQYILQRTGMSNLTLVAHSQGTSQSFVALIDPATKVWLQGRINLFVALSPVTYLKKVQQSDILKLIAGEYKLLTGILAAACPHGVFKQTFCLAATTQHFPAGTNVKSLSHFGQLMESGFFRDFDYGQESNMLIYGSPDPPIFDVTTLDEVPMGLFVAGKDEVVDAVNGLRLAAEMQDAEAPVTLEVFPEFGHSAWTSGSQTEFHTWMPKFLDLLERYNPVDDFRNAAAFAMAQATTTTTTMGEDLETWEAVRTAF